MPVDAMLATITEIRYFKEINAMTRRYLKILLVGSLFTLSACAQQTEVRQMKQSVNTLNTAMDKLNKETVKITQQNALNAKSSSGVYLLPGSNTPARLNSQLGTLKMSLVNVAANAMVLAQHYAFRGNPTILCQPLAAPSSGGRFRAPPRTIRK